MKKQFNLFKVELRADLEVWGVGVALDIPMRALYFVLGPLELTIQLKN